MPAYKIAYMFDRGSVTARLDLPGEMSPDGKARILVADMEGRKSRQLFADNLQPDPGFDAKYFSRALVDAGVFNDLTLVNPKAPFVSQTTDQFIAQARLAAFDQFEESQDRLVATRQTSASGTEVNQTLVFDKGIGAVTSVQVKESNAAMQSNGTVTITYTSSGGKNYIQKVESTHSSELVGKARQPLIEMKADEVLKAGQKPKLRPGEVIVMEFKGPNADGVYDPNKYSVKVTQRYENLQVDQVKPDFFAVGE
jgi:hypothetical protein